MKDIYIDNFNIYRQRIITLVNKNTVLNIFGNNIIKNCNYNNYSSTADIMGSLILVLGKMNLVENSTLLIDNNISKYNGIIYFNDDADMEMGVNSKLIISNNTIYPSTYVSDQNVLYLRNKSLVYGSIEITNNNFIGASYTNNNMLSAMVVGDTISITDGSFQIYGNEVWTDDTKTTKNTNAHVYQVYTTITDNTTPIFEQVAGTKFANTSSMSIAFATNGVNKGAGIIYKHFDKDNVSDFYQDIYKKCFTADTYSTSTIDRTYLKAR